MKYPSISNASWFEDIAEKKILSPTAEIPSEQVRKAQETGANQDAFFLAQEVVEKYA